MGRARSFDLTGYLAARKDALLLLTTALGENDHSGLFRATEAYRAGGEGKAQDRPADRGALFDSRRPDVSEGGIGGVDAEPGSPGGAGRHRRAG